MEPTSPINSVIMKEKTFSVKVSFFVNEKKCFIYNFFTSKEIRYYGKETKNALLRRRDFGCSQKCKYCGEWLEEKQTVTKKMVACPVCTEQREEDATSCENKETHSPLSYPTISSVSYASNMPTLTEWPQESNIGFTSYSTTS